MTKQFKQEKPAGKFTTRNGLSGQRILTMQGDIVIDMTGSHKAQVTGVSCFEKVYVSLQFIRQDGAVIA